MYSTSGSWTLTENDFQRLQAAEITFYVQRHDELRDDKENFISGSKLNTCLVNKEMIEYRTK